MVFAIKARTLSSIFSRSDIVLSPRGYRLCPHGLAPRRALGERGLGRGQLVKVGSPCAREWKALRTRERRATPACEERSSVTPSQIAFASGDSLFGLVAISAVVLSLQFAMTRPTDKQAMILAAMAYRAGAVGADVCFELHRWTPFALWLGRSASPRRAPL